MEKGGIAMKFEELDKIMRAHERSLDSFVPENTILCARLDGRSFTRLTKEICRFKAPFDRRFHDHMINTAKHLMECGFNFSYGYTQSDEISLIFDSAENPYGGKIRKIITVLAGEASAAFSLETGTPASFDCRLIPLPDKNSVRDYFAWRQADLYRNAIFGHCYYALISDGFDYLEATKQLEGKSAEYKQELLKDHGIDTDALPLWQKYGSELFTASREKTGTNPLTGESVKYFRNELCAEEIALNGEKFGLHAAGFVK